MPFDAGVDGVTEGVNCRASRYSLASSSPQSIIPVAPSLRELSSEARLRE